MQIMPQTAVQLAAEGGYAHTPDKLLDPMYNMTLGALFLKKLTERFPQGLFLATAGYNAGPGAVNKWLKTVGDPNAQVFGTSFHFPASVINWIEAIPFDVTRDYVHRAVESYTVYAYMLGEKPQAIQKAVFGKAF
jgi:soluble lytic murein transglycosylase